MKQQTVDSKPGTRVDGYLHHEQKKLVLQVSKKRGEAILKGAELRQVRLAKGRVG